MVVRKSERQRYQLRTGDVKASKYGNVYVYLINRKQNKKYDSGIERH